MGGTVFGGGMMMAQLIYSYLGVGSSAEGPNSSRLFQDVSFPQPPTLVIVHRSPFVVGGRYIGVGISRAGIGMPLAYYAALKQGRYI